MSARLLLVRSYRSHHDHMDHSLFKLANSLIPTLLLMFDGFVLHFLLTFLLLNFWTCSSYAIQLMAE